MNTDNDLPRILSLLGHAHVPMALRCLASLRRHHRPAFRLCLHDDGSLTAADREQIEETLPGTQIVSRPEADAAMEDALKNFPACRAYRLEHALSAKALDIPLMHRGPLVYCDTDILFLRPFGGFHRLLETTRPPLIFMRDVWDSYSIRYWQLLNPWRQRLIQRLNTGIMLMDPAQLDLDFMERLLRQPRDQHFSHFEQTYWSAMAHRLGGRLLSPGQIYYPPGADGAEDSAHGAVAWHFVGPFRDTFARWEAEEAADTAADALPTVELATFQPATLTPWRYLDSRLRKGRWVRERRRAEAAQRA